MKDRSVTLPSIRAAAQRLKGVATRTPLLQSRRLDGLAENRVFLKSEHLQRVGAFKFRGAQNAVAQLSQEEIQHGVVTQSSGNHAQALSLAASLRGIPAYIVMPSNAPKPKIAAVRDYGATITFCEPRVSERERTMTEIRNQTGAVYVPPYDHPSVISGQGTLGLELLEQIPSLQAVIAPVGGGGLLSGIASAIKLTSPNVKVYGAEPLGADDASKSLAANQWIPQNNPNTIADGLLTSLGDHTWPLIQRYVDDIFTVTEPQIITSMRWIWERMKQLIEPSAAVAVAALLSDQFPRDIKNANVAIVLSGGNVDVDQLPWTSGQPRP